MRHRRRFASSVAAHEAHRRARVGYAALREANMATFGGDEISWQNIDFTALARGGGLASIAPVDRDPCRSWLLRRRYQVVTIDGGADAAAMRGELSRWLRFEELYGHQFNGDLDALRDGFVDLEVPEAGGVVLELLGLDRLWLDDREWAQGLLQIACETSAYNLAIGRRFFSICVLEPDSPVVGAAFGSRVLPRCWDETSEW
jgi:hypothetical protein